MLADRLDALYLVKEGTLQVIRMKVDFEKNEDLKEQFQMKGLSALAEGRHYEVWVP